MRWVAAWQRCLTLALPLALGGCSLLFSFLDPGGAADAGADGYFDAGSDGDADADADGDGDAGLDAGVPDAACEETIEIEAPTGACALGMGIRTIPEAFEPVDDYSTATQADVSVNEAVLYHGTIDTGGDEDWWVINLAAWNRLIVYAQGGLNAEEPPEGIVVWLYSRESEAANANLEGDSCDRLLGSCPLGCSDDVSFDEAMVVTAPANGMYWIRAAHQDGEDYGMGYDLCIAVQ